MTFLVLKFHFNHSTYDMQQCGICIGLQILMGKPKGIGNLEKFRRWQDNIKWVLLKLVGRMRTHLG